MKIRPFFLPAIVAIGIVYSAVSISRTQPKNEVSDPPEPPPRSSFASAIAAVGLVEPSSESIAIGSPLSGIVEKVHVAPGQNVDPGQPLFTLDHRHLDAQHDISLAKIAHASAESAATRAMLDQARRRFKSAAALVASRAIAAEEHADRASEVTRLDAQVIATEASIQLVRAELAAVEIEIARGTVRSPIAGTALQVRVRPGEFIEGGSSTDPRLVIGRIDSLHIRADVDEFEIPRLTPGARATASPRGDASKVFQLEFVRFEPFVIPKKSLTGESAERVDTRVLQVIYRLAAPAAALFAGQQVDLFIEAAGN